MIAGFLSMAELTKRFSISYDLLRETIEERLNKQIFGQLDSGLLYTDEFVQVLCCSPARPPLGGDSCVIAVVVAVSHR
jgi:hypothetical protein